ncbi:uncharacterized protein LOC110683250 [Chenopodium quinoa]|uniref:uncharacterized protein LOC110683250 n=1 Tax=Chenopodium quinoa TaxID=63459 RepID=UPI000B782DB3|nr:uncharacterized protein LOC110683250 [Chenopodium quinoa]
MLQIEKKKWKSVCSCVILMFVNLLIETISIVNTFQIISYQKILLPQLMPNLLCKVLISAFMLCQCRSRKYEARELNYFVEAYFLPGAKYLCDSILVLLQFLLVSAMNILIQLPA